jgi:hypothetical protein
VSGFSGFTPAALSTFSIPTYTCMHTKFGSQINCKEQKTGSSQEKTDRQTGQGSLLEEAF